jgi:hypothetical protein
MVSQDGEMAADPPVPRVVKAADTQALLALEDTAAILGLSQRLLPAWLEENVAATGLHYLWPGLWHRLSHRPEVSPHLRCELLLQLRDGEQVLSLLDIMPADFQPLVTVASRSEVLQVRHRMDSARSVREWTEEQAGEA